LLFSFSFTKALRKGPLSVPAKGKKRLFEPRKTRKARKETDCQKKHRKHHFVLDAKPKVSMMA
jgi:hypothetical protein